MTSFSIKGPDMTNLKWIHLAHKLDEHGIGIKQDKRTSKYGIFSRSNPPEVHWVDTIDEALESAAFFGYAG